MSAIKKVFDVMHKGAVIGLVSVFAFQVYQIGSKAMSGVVDSPMMHSTYHKEVEEKVKEEYRKSNIVDHRDWYDQEDDSYLKKQVRADITRPDFKKQHQ